MFVNYSSTTQKGVVTARLRRPRHLGHRQCHWRCASRHGSTAAHMLAAQVGASLKPANGIRRLTVRASSGNRNDGQLLQKAGAGAGTGTSSAAPPAQQSTGLSSTATLVNVAVGAGILSMPYAYSLVGWAMGLGLTVAVAAVEAFTLCVLCSFAEHTGATSYSALVREVLGPGAAAALAVVLWVYLLLSCTAYLIIAADCLCPLLAAAFGPDAWWTGRQAVVAAVGLGITLPLSLPRTLGAAAGVSTLKVYAILFVVGAVVLRSAGTLAAPGYDWAEVQATTGSLQGLFVALPILAFGFQCHTAVVDIWNELEDEPSWPLFSSSSQISTGSGSGGSSGKRGTSSIGSNSSSGKIASTISSGGGAGSSSSQGLGLGLGLGLSPKLRGMAGVAGATMGLMVLFYSAMGVAGYLAFAGLGLGSVEGNVMNSFPQQDSLVQMARALVGLIVVAAFPVNHVPARSTLLDLAGQLSRHSRHSSPSADASTAEDTPSDAAYTAETLVFCGVATAVAASVSDLGTMFQLIGGTAAAVLIFGIPGALLLSAATQGNPQQAGQDPRQLRLRRGGLLVAGVGLEAITVASWALTLHNLFGAAAPPGGQ